MSSTIGTRQSGMRPTWRAGVGAGHPRHVREAPWDPTGAAVPGAGPGRIGSVRRPGPHGRGVPLLSPISFAQAWSS